MKNGKNVIFNLNIFNLNNFNHKINIMPSQLMEIKKKGMLFTE